MVQRVSEADEMATDFQVLLHMIKARESYEQLETEAVTIERRAESTAQGVRIAVQALKIGRVNHHTEVRMRQFYRRYGPDSAGPEGDKTKGPTAVNGRRAKARKGHVGTR